MAEARHPSAERRPANMREDRQELEGTISDCQILPVLTEATIQIQTIAKSATVRMLSRSLSDCQSLTLNVMIQVSQFVSNSQLCH